MGYRDYPTKIPTDELERAEFFRKVGLDHLLRVWQWFEVYHLTPYVPPYFALPESSYNDKKNKEDEEGGGEGGEGGSEGGSGVKIIDIKNGLVVYDFGDYLSTSAGADENYGPLAYGRLFRTIKTMMEIIEKRGAIEIAFGKECLGAAKLYAWRLAVNANLNVLGYRPTAEDVMRLEEIYGGLEPELREVLVPE